MTTMPKSAFPFHVPVIQVGIEFTILDCATCGVLFAITHEFEEHRRYDGETFYCPTGHGNAWTGERQQLQAELERQRAVASKLANSNDRLCVEKASLEKDRRRLQREQRAAERRITNGVCTHCNRTFADVARHMRSKHADLVVTGEQAAN